LDEEKLTEKDRERAQKVCMTLKISEGGRSQTGLTDEQRAELGYDKIAEQQETIKELEAENEELKMQIASYNNLEKEYKNMQRRCIELESENLMLERRLSLLTSEGNEITREETIDSDVNGGVVDNVEHFSDNEFDGIEDEGLRKAIKENQEKMTALRKEIRSLIVQSNPGTTELRTKRQTRKLKDGGYDYSEEIY